MAITVTSVNDAPVATPTSVTLPEGDTQTNFVLSGTDVDGDALTYTIVTYPTHGILGGTAPNLIYLPLGNYNGNDSFTFRVSDGQAVSSPATVTITVTPVNDVPVAQSQSVSTPYNTPVAITLSGTDAEGSPLSYLVMSQPANGVLSVDRSELDVHAENVGFNGGSSFTFIVNDGFLPGQPTVGSCEHHGAGGHFGPDRAERLDCNGGFLVAN